MIQIPVSDVFPPDSHCNSSIFDCAQLYPPCRSSKEFDFASLWNITLKYNISCPSGPWLFPQSGSSPICSLALNNEACQVIAGAGYKTYPTADIWYRLTTWKFPLFQLIATSPRPPLSLSVEIFTTAHLLGDPIGSMTDLLRKFESCQRRAVNWQIFFSESPLLSILPVSLVDDVTESEQRQRIWKAFAIITDSYDEWGSVMGDRASEKMKEKLEELSRPDASEDLGKEFFRVCLTTAGALAADRSTRFLPVVVAEAFFILTIAIAMIRTKLKGEEDNPATFINIEMHSIAFTALFFWLISAVIMTSVIGASQTAEAIPRILDRFRKDLESVGCALQLPSRDRLRSDDRKWKGGIYLWQPERSWQPGRSQLSFPALENARIETSELLRNSVKDHQAKIFLLKVWPWMSLCLPLATFSAAVMTGMTTSFAVPPVGWSCRSQGQMLIVCTWLSSYLISYLGGAFRREGLFTFTMCKDIVAVIITWGWIIVTQFGIYNRCDCWTKSGTVGLALPEEGATAKTLWKGLEVGGNFTIIVTLGVLVQLVFIPLLLLWRYYSAVRVFLQRDDGKSNLELPRQITSRLKQALAWCCSCWRRRAKERSGTKPGHVRFGSSQNLAEHGQEFTGDLTPVASYQLPSQNDYETSRLLTNSQTEREYFQSQLLIPRATYARERSPHERLPQNNSPSFGESPSR